MPLPLLIGQRVAERRAALRLRLEEIASRTGVSRAMISRIERGEVHASAVVLDRLCAGLGISLSALFVRDAAAPLVRRAEAAGLAGSSERPMSGARWRRPERDRR